MSQDSISRRHLLKGAIVGAAALPAAALVTGEAVAAPALLDEKDPLAKNLGYVADAKKVDPKTNPTYKPGQLCSNCLQYNAAATAVQGPCNLFPGKVVKGAGWCRVYVAKPGAAPAAKPAATPAKPATPATKPATK